MAQSIVKAYKENLEGIKDAIGRGGKMSLNVKTTTITEDYAGTFALTDFDSEVDRTVRKRYGLLENLNLGQTSSKFVTYVQQTAEGRARFVGEGGAKIQGEPQWTEVSEEVKKNCRIC